MKAVLTMQKKGLFSVNSLRSENTAQLHPVIPMAEGKEPGYSFKP